jgi:hypothetical protein
MRKSMKVVSTNKDQDILPLKKDKQRKEEETAKDLIKQSDIRVSNPLKINDFKKSTSNLAEGVKVKEGAFAESMRQASRAFKRKEILDLKLNSKPSMQAIMEVEDMMVGEVS